MKILGNLEVDQPPLPHPLRGPDSCVHLRSFYSIINPPVYIGQRMIRVEYRGREDKTNRFRLTETPPTQFHWQSVTSIIIHTRQTSARNADGWESRHKRSEKGKVKTEYSAWNELSKRRTVKMLYIANTPLYRQTWVDAKRIRHGNP